MELQTGVLLCRVSTKKQEKEWNSLERQERRGRSFAAEKNIKILKVFHETFSWKAENREVTEDAIEYAVVHRADFLIIPEIDRFTRWGSAVYLAMKSRLEEQGIKLIDTHHIIQDSTIVYENEDVDMSQYKWNKENASIYAEVMLSTQAEIEGRKILQRLIPKEIELEQEWYQVRAPLYWFANKKINTKNGKRVIQVPHQPFFGWLLEMFEARARWILADQEIVDILNNRWATKKSGKPLDVKYMLELIGNPLYAGIKRTKWTGNKPIQVPYDMLPIELWNQANRGRKYIYKVDDEIVIEDNIERISKLSEDVRDSFIFRGIISYEGRSMTPYITKNNVYYRSGRLVRPPFNISEKKLLTLFWQILEKYNFSDEYRAVIEQYIDDFIWFEISESNKKIKAFEKEIEDLKNQNKEIVRKNLKGLVSDDMMQEIISENEKEVENKEIELIKEKWKSKLNATQVVELCKFLLDTKKIRNSANKYQKKELIKLIVVELSFNEKKELRIAETQVFRLIKNHNYSKWYTTNAWITNFLHQFFSTLLPQVEKLSIRVKHIRSLWKRL